MKINYGVQIKTDTQDINISDTDHLHEVFISNASSDQGMAEIVCTALELSNIRCWIAPRDVTPNQNYHLCIQNAIKASIVVVMVVSQGSETSGTVSEELALANQYGVKIIPFDYSIVKSTKVLLSVAYILANPLHPIGIRLKQLVSETKTYINQNINDSEQLQTDTVIIIEENSPKQEAIPTTTDNKTESELPPAPVPSEQKEKKPLVFISANSRDYDMAGKIYRYLSENHVDTFFAAETLKILGNADYRNQIDDFLDRCDHMIVVTSSKDNIKSSWVEAEWGFFINEKRSGRKQGNIVTVTTAEVKIGDLPPSLRYFEVMSERALSERLLQYLI